MIDLHAHILPAIDDGASTEEEALQMAEQALQDGIGTVVATPHSPDMSGVVWRQGEVPRRVSALQAAADKRGISIALFPGEELYLSRNSIARFEAGEICALGAGRYLLFELPLLSYPSYTDELLFGLLVRGARLIMAHPERNRAISATPNLVLPLVERGVLMQVTASSLTGEFGSEAMETAMTLLEHNLAHVIASDAHSSESRAPCLSRAVAAASGVVGSARAGAMVTSTPDMIIKGEEPAVEAPRAVAQRGRRWFWTRSAGERK